MRRVLVALAACSLLAGVAPRADAVPPWRFSGSGQLSPGVGTGPQSVWFTGIAVDMVNGTLADCSWGGGGPVVGAAAVRVTITSGGCGPYSLVGCRFVLRPGLVSLMCRPPIRVVFAVVTYENVNPTVSFQMQGVVP